MAGYGWIVVVALILIAGVILVVKDRNNAKKWLVYAVTVAENELGSGTGALKLQMVYDEFITKFPIAAKFMTFNHFKKLVDKALNAMKDMMDNNDSIKNTIQK